MIEMGARVRELRIQLGLTQRELAESIGVTQGMIGHIEAGIKTPSLPVAKRLADALNVTVNDLVSADHVASPTGA